MKLTRVFFSVALPVVVAACGGGGGDGASSGSTNQPQADQFIAAVQAIVATTADDSEPQAVDATTVTSADDEDPASLS
jgi:hypothetical protein